MVYLNTTSSLMSGVTMALWPYNFYPCNVDTSSYVALCYYGLVSVSVYVPNCGHDSSAHMVVVRNNKTWCACIVSHARLTWLWPRSTANGVPPLSRPLAQASLAIFGAGQCAEHCSLQMRLSQEGLSPDALICFRLCRKRAAQAFYKTDIFGPEPYSHRLQLCGRVE